MKTIELEIWEPNPEDPRYMRYAGQPVAEEVFAELGQRLEGMGMMPDEYFLMDREWENGREIPRGADIFVTTDYGESEGVYLDGYLKWYEDGKPVTKSFFTGKTIGETGYDLDRIFLISSAITKAFHGEGSHNEQAQGAILMLDAEEKDALEAVLAKQEQTAEIQSLIAKLNGEVPQQTRTQPDMMTEMKL